MPKIVSCIAKHTLLPYSGLGLTELLSSSSHHGRKRNVWAPTEPRFAFPLISSSDSSELPLLRGMGSQNALGNDRLRPYWTPLMERYFIDLMLDQLQRGNRMGHTFNKQAWTDMLTLFNAKFGSQYDKDVLKSRYTNLWKQFNDLKNLLCQSGFSWDETRQMVVADDFVWESYIKAHPDARTYRTKAVINFNDLCLIYGYTVADGRYSLSSHDLGFNDDDVLGDGTGSITPSNNEHPRTEWIPAMDQFFIELMLDQVGRGNKLSNTFNKQAWTDMLVVFNSKFGPQHGKRVLRHRFKKLWKYYCFMSNLLKQKGFSWDELQQTIVADDDLWDAYIKVHPHARTYRMKTLPNYYDLVLIYGDGSENETINLHEIENLNVKPEIIVGERKGSQNPIGSDRTRTYWTPPMDRYLIDLLVDQVYQGNKLGKTFITEAWNDMVASFNAHFRSHHDKDVLKNRYKHLRRQHNNVKVLLEQNGFSWSETQEMVTAEDHVWDAYTKVHPDARSYRIKTLPGYQKLCVIFGEENSERRYNHLARVVDTSSELPILMTDGDKDNQFPQVYVPLGLEWTLAMDLHFVDLMIKEVQRGNKVASTFTEQAWASMVDSFNEKFELRLEKHLLKDRYIFLMKQHNDISNLLNHCGFSWDRFQQMITTEGDEWDAFIKEYPDVMSYTNAVLYPYHDMCKIYGSEVSEARISSQDQGIEANYVSYGIEMIEVREEILEAGNLQISDQERKRPLEMPPDSGHPKKLQTTDMRMQETLTEMAGVVKTLASNKDNILKWIGRAIDALQATPDLDEELMLDACDLLEDERKAKTFLALDVTLRKKWLLRKLRAK